MQRPRGQSSTEYIIILVLIAIGVIVGLRYFGGDILAQFREASTRILGIDSSSDKSSDEEGSKFITQQEQMDQEIESAVQEKIAKQQASTNPGLNSAVDRDNENINKKVDRLRAEGPGSQPMPDMEGFNFDWSTIGFIAGLVLILGMTVIFAGGRRKKAKKNLREESKSPYSESGQAMVEFIFISITFIFVILGIIQLAMCLNAYTMVRYAAYNAARAAIVHCNDQSQMMYYAKEAARMSLVPVFPKHGRATHMRGVTENYLAARDMDWDGSLTYLKKPITDVTVRTGAKPHGPEVIFDHPAQAGTAYLSVRVRHQYELVMPLVNRMLFWAYLKFLNAKKDGFEEETIMQMSRRTDIERRTGSFRDIEYRIPIIAYYTMPMQTDFKIYN